MDKSGTTLICILHSPTHPFLHSGVKAIELLEGERKSRMESWYLSELSSEEKKKQLDEEIAKAKVVAVNKANPLHVE